MSTSSGGCFETAGDSRRPTEYDRTFKLPTTELRSTPGSSKTDVRFCLYGHNAEFGFVLFSPQEFRSILTLRFVLVHLQLESLEQFGHNDIRSSKCSHNRAMCKKLCLFTSSCIIALNIIHVIITNTIMKISNAVETLIYEAYTNLQGSIC